MFERFTRDARAAVMSAVSESERRGDRHIGTEHLLLGVIASANPMTSAAVDAAGLHLQAARRALDDADSDALAAIGIDVTAARARSEAWRRSPGRFLRRPAHRPFTGGAKQTLEATLREALALRDRHIGTEHLLLALCARSAPDPASLLLRVLGVDAGRLRTDVEHRLRRAA